MKRIFALLLITILVFSTVTALGETIDYSNIKVYVNGIRIALFDSTDNLQQAAVIDGVIYLPIESLINGIGGNYEYDSGTETITIQLGGISTTETAASSNTENALESKAYTWSGFRDSYIEAGKKVASAFMSYARNNFKNPSSVRLEKAYRGSYYYLLDVSAENSYGGRTREYYFVDTDEEFKVDRPWSALVDSYITLGFEIKDDDFAWFSSLFK